jgi:nucleoside-diphosphate-sugar epimerase
VTFFITGANGYVGRNLVKYFRARNHAVKALVRNPDSAKVLSDLGAEIVKGDLLSSIPVEMLRNVDVLIHAAADTDHKNISATQFQTNVMGTELILKVAKQAGVKKAIYISTESVLLTGSALKNATEKDAYPLKHVGEYSRTKQLAEVCALSMSDQEMSVVVLRPRFVWGEDDTTAMPYLIESVRNNKFAWIDGGNYLTSTTHIQNLCSAVQCAVEKGQGQEVYFVSDGAPRTFREMISGLICSQGLHPPSKSVPRKVLRLITIIEEIRRQVFPRSKPLPLTYQEYATSAVEVTLDISKAERELGYKPQINFEQGLKTCCVLGKE